MTVVVTEGSGGSGSTGSGMGSLVKDLLPIALLLGAGYLAYKMLFSGSDGGSTGGGQASGNQNAVSPGANVGTGAAPAPQYYYPPPAQNMAAPQPVFIEAGPATPITYWPQGQGVITTSRPLNQAEQNQVLWNLANSQASQGITNAWWQPQTLTNPGNWGINSQGSPQSNIAPGVRHCAGPGPGAPPTDSWHYC